MLDEARAAVKAKGPRCSVGILIQTLTEAEQAEVAEALASNVESSGLARAMAARGWEVRAGNLARHRAGECACR